MANRPIYAYDRQTRQFAMARGPEAVEIWSLDAPEESQTCETRQTALVAMALLDGLLVTVHETGTVIGWARGDEEWEQRWSEELDRHLRAAASRAVDGALWLVVGDDDGGLQPMIIAGGEPSLGEVQAQHQGAVEVIAFDEHRQRLASSGRDRAIGVWSMSDGEEGPTLEREQWLQGSGGWPLSLAFDRSGRRLASGAMDNGVYLWRLDEGQKEVRFEHHGWIDDVVWGGDDEAILSASWDDSVGVYGCEPLKPRCQLMVHGDDVVAVLAVPDSDWVAAASYDGTISLWDWRQGQWVASLKGHGDWVTDLVWVGDGRFLSLSSDRTARLWSIDDEACLAILGDPLLQGFELGGNMGLESFGVDGASGASTGALEDQSLGAWVNEEQSGKLVVRRFDDEPMVDDNQQDTAVAILEKAVDEVDEVGLDSVEAEGGIDVESEGESAGGLLDDIDLDLDIDLGESSAAGDEGALGESSSLDDVDALDQASELGEVSSVGESSELGEGADLDEASALEQASQLGESSSLDDVDALDQASELGEVSSVGDLDEASALDMGESPMDESVFGDDSDGLGDVESMVADAFSEVEYEEASLPEVDDVDDVPTAAFEDLDDASDLEEASDLGEASDPGEASDQQQPGRQEKSTALGMGVSQVEEEERPDLTPDEDILERAFSMRQEPRESGGDSQGSQGDRGGDDGATEEDADDESDGEADGGHPWDRQGAGQTVTNARPIGAESSASEAREEADSPAAGQRADDEEWTRVPTAQGVRNLEDGPSPIDEDKPSGNTLGGGEEPFMPGFSGDPSSTQFGGPAVATEASDGQEEISTPRAKAGLIRPAGGESDDADTPEPAANPGRPKGRSRRLGERLQEFKAAQAERRDDEEARLPDGLGNLETASRLTPGQAVTDAELARIPEPRTRESSEDDGTYRCEEVSLDQIWSRATAMPPMGILNRRIDAGVAYEPAYQVQMESSASVIPAVSSHEKRLLTAGVDGEVRLWKIKGDGDVAFRIDDLSAPLINAGYLQGERFFYTLDEEGEVRLWFVPRASQIGDAIPYGRFRIAGSAPSAAVVVGDDDHLLVGNQRGSLAFWDLKEGRSLGELKGHAAPITAVAMGNKGPISASIDGQIRFWNQQGMQIDQIDLEAHVADLAAAHGHLIWCELSGALRVMKEGASRATKVQGHYGEGRGVDMRDDGYAISGGEDGRLLIYDAASGDLAQEIPIPAPIERVIMRRKVLVAACAGGQTYVFRRVAKK